MYTYHGDVNIQHGGMFLDLDTFKEMGDYVPVVKVTNMDSACGLIDCVMIEIGSIYIPDDPEKRQSALSVCGWENEKKVTPLMLISSFDAYHGIDLDYCIGSILLQTVLDEDVEPEEWDTEFHESGMSLKDFIEDKYVNS